MEGTNRRVWNFPLFDMCRDFLNGNRTAEKNHQTGVLVDIYNSMYCMNMMKKKAFFLPFAGDNNMTFIDRFCQKATAQLSSLSNHSRLQIIWHHLLQQQWVSKRACLEDVQNIDTLSRYRWHRVCTSKMYVCTCTT